MMPPMKQALVGVAVAVAASGSFGCGGGGAKDADSPPTCPEGTVLNGSDCLPAGTPPPSGDDSSSNGSGSGSGDTSKKKHHAKSDDDSSGGSASAGGGGDSTASSSGSTTPYDKDEIEAKMKRSAKQIKANCGAATDDEGKATGPWGSLKATITLGRNGHVKDVSIPDPYNGKPVGTCVSRQLMKLVYPPYAGSSDSTIEWDFELVKPK
jgi:hypothetical protein